MLVPAVSVLPVLSPVGSVPVDVSDSDVVVDDVDPDVVAGSVGEALVLAGPVDVSGSSVPTSSGPHADRSSNSASIRHRRPMKA